MRFVEYSFLRKILNTSTNYIFMNLRITQCECLKAYNRTYFYLFFSLGGSTGENDLWQGLKAPSTYHDQRSKFRQQASPYVRPT